MNAILGERNHQHESIAKLNYEKMKGDYILNFYYGKNVCLY